MKKLLRLLVSLVLLTATVVKAETLTNDSVVQLHKLSLGDSVIIQKIKASTCNFDMSVDALKALKDAGLSDDVIQAMLLVSTPPAPAPAVAAPAPAPPAAVAPADPNDPKAAHASGIYLYEEIDGKPKMTKMALSRSRLVQTGSGIAVTFGGHMSFYETLPGPHAALQISDPKPVFYFYFDKVNSSLGRPDMSASSPDDFAMVALEVHKKDNEVFRRVAVSRANMGGLHGGVNKKVLQTTSSEMISDGIFKVTPTDGLKPGEYAIIQMMNGNIVGSQQMPDFGIAGGK